MYVTGSLKQVELKCCTKIKDWEYETMRYNCFFNMSGEQSLSMDELNEFLNSWNKASVTSPNFKTFCKQSRHVMLLRKCEYGAFGKLRKSANQRKKGTSQHQAVEKRESCCFRTHMFLRMTPGFVK